jgi:4-hydroxybenzoate polyprenyltransferase
MSSLRVFLVLGRVSNLPTVWSNCLAAWFLAGGGAPGPFVLLCAGATLLYTGGMFLNDAFDVEFDRKHRPERPIISGAISARAVWAIAGALLILGLGAIVPLGPEPFLFGVALLGTIVFYDAVHKRTMLAPLLMAGCRFLLYLVAASAAHAQVKPIFVEKALALAVYILGISYLARKESTGGVTTRWATLLLLGPILLAVIGRGASNGIVWIAVAAQGVWIFWCLWSPPGKSRNFSSGVAGLLAGIVLVDWLAAVGSAQALSVVFAALFVLALLSQRFAPAT